MLLKLTYHRESDVHTWFTVIGDPYGVRDLYWQLTHNYSAVDGTKIGKISVQNLEGVDVTETFFHHPYGAASQLHNCDRD